VSRGAGRILLHEWVRWRFIANADDIALRYASLERWTRERFPIAVRSWNLA